MAHWSFAPPSSSNPFAGLQTGEAPHSSAAEPHNTPSLAPAPSDAPRPRKKSKYAPSDYSESDEEIDSMMAEVNISQSAAPASREHTRVLETIPEQMKFREFANCEDNPFPDKSVVDYDVTVIHRDYRGLDRLKFKDDKFKVSKQPAQVLFLQELIPGEPTRYRMSQGVINLKRKQEDKQIKVSFHMDSQMPSIKLYISRPDSDDKEVTYSIFANALRPKGEYPNRKGMLEQQPAGVSMMTYTDEMDEYDEAEFTKHIALGHLNLTEFAKARNLLQIRLHFIPPGESDKQKFRCRPIWSGLKRSELDAMQAKGADPSLAAEMTAFESTILFLDRAEQLSIFRRLSCSDMAMIEKFKNFFVGSLHLCSLYRNFWYYQLQYEKPKSGSRLNKDVDIFDSQCNLERTLPPRWMITKFLGTSPAQGAPITKVKALNWSAFTQPQKFPTVEDCAFLVRLALARERNSQQRIIHDMGLASNDGCTARFEPVESLPGSFVLRISARGASPGVPAELVKPELDARVKVRVNVPGGATFHYEGQIVEAPGSGEVEADKSKDFDFVAQVLGRQHDFGADSHPIELQFVDDPTSANRARMATESMAATADMKRKEGVDIPAFIFHADAQIAADKQNAGKDIPETIMIDLQRRAKQVWGLNPEQIQAVKQTFQSETGLALIYGPPGTGKTRTTVAAAHEHVRLGSKVLYTCPSNKAVDTALSAFREKTGPVRAIRFVGGFKSYEKRKMAAAPGVDLSEWEGLVNPTMTNAMKANPGTLFHLNMEELVKKWSQTTMHAMYKGAKEYLDCLAKATKLTGDKASENKVKIRVLQEKLTEHYIANDVDIIFTTCASACHDTLATHFKPSTAFIDEAGQATIADVCMALDPFKESIKCLTMSGDYKQLRPVVTAPLANEAVSMLTESLFQQILTDPEQPYAHVMLTTQYRQHPDLVAWANATFYDGQLQTAGVAAQGSPVSKTMRQYFRQLKGGLKNLNSCRIAIDVAEPNARSEPYLETTSFCNKEEARIIVGLVRGLLDFRAQADAANAHKYATVKPSDIAIITPYKGQQRLIRDMLTADKTSPIGQLMCQVVVKGTVSTTWGIQSGECEIAFISLCVRVPERPLAKAKFVAFGNALCLQNTRARRFQVTTGNFSGWLNDATALKGTGKWASAYYRSFRLLIKHHYQKGDIVSSRDVDSTLLAPPGKAKKLTKSHFYNAVVTTLDPSQARGIKRKAAGKSMDNHGKDTRKAAVDHIGEPEQKGLSNRALKKLRQKAKHEELAQKAADEAQ